MKTDPRAACSNEKEALLWAIIHDLIAHPLMGLTLYSKASLRFHDFTSHRAWPRVLPSQHEEFAMQSARFGAIKARWIGGQFYAFDHPTVSHTFVTNAADAVEAMEKAETAFGVLADEFGGAFLGLGAGAQKEST